MTTPLHLANWSGPAVVEQCRFAYHAYRDAKTRSYQAYFAGKPGLRAEDHAYKARDIGAALPEGWSRLAELLPKSERHLHHLSGNSSQVLALGLLGVAAEREPSLRWLWDGLGPLPPPKSVRPDWQFERKLAREVLGEQPRQTSIDLLVDDPAALLCIECKWTETGIGACSCGKNAATIADCGKTVLARDRYWQVASEVFHLPERRPGEPCPLSFTYQAVRNVAAALALARPDQEPVFGLIYDAENPYFSGCGAWRGWPAALHATLDAVDAPVRFVAISWQELLPLLPLDSATVTWASEKHGLSQSA